MICEECGQEFEPRMCRQRFCSHECQRAYHNRKGRETRAANPKPKLIKCLWCGQMFTKVNGNQRYCSDKCKHEVEKEQRERYNKKRYRGVPLQKEDTEELGGYLGLANAIVIQATKDYRRALRELVRHPHNERAKGDARSCERFFMGEWFGLLTTLDPDALVYKLRKEVT